MNEEINDLTFNNNNPTFSLATNNIGTSDELNVGPLFQYQTDTQYAKRKRVAKIITVTGVSLALTATIVSSGTILSNVFIVSPPKVSNTVYEVNEEGFSYSFEIKNDLEYKAYYYLKLDGKSVLEEDCSKAGEYKGIYSDIKDGQELKFVVEFTNSFDYIKAISIYQTTVERN